jgi:hypothetical protein
MIKPCPFCGKDPETGNSPTSVVWCKTEMCPGNACGWQREHWNRRAPDPLVLRLARALVGVVGEHCWTSPADVHDSMGASEAAGAIRLLCDLGILAPVSDDGNRFVKAAETSPQWDGEKMPEVKP